MGGVEMATGSHVDIELGHSIYIWNNGHPSMLVDPVLSIDLILSTYSDIRVVGNPNYPLTEYAKIGIYGSEKSRFFIESWDETMVENINNRNVEDTFLSDIDGYTAFLVGKTVHMGRLHAHALCGLATPCNAHRVVHPKLGYLDIANEAALDQELVEQQVYIY